MLVVPMGTKHSDLIWGIHMMASKLRDKNILVEFFHLNRHQDDIILFEDLDWLAQLNVLMDRMAKSKLDRLAQAPIAQSPDGIQFEGWSCMVDGVKATIDLTVAILHFTHSRPMIEYLVDPHHDWMDESAFHLVDWSVVCGSLLGFSPLFRMWASKHISRYCGVGCMQLRWGFWDHDQCPCCKQPDEMMTHLLLCRHSGMTLTWEMGINTIREWLEEVDTHAKIVECLMDGRESVDSSSFNGST